MDLCGKVAVVTGASRGIGRALALELAGRGCRLLLTALEEDELHLVAAEAASSQGADVDARAADLTDSSSRNALISWLLTQSEKPDILILNAGGGRFQRFEDAASSDGSYTLALNAGAPMQLTAALLPLLRERPRARIVFISSAVARLPYPGLAVYGASKGFLSSLAESLACELAGTGIDVLCFHPGFTRTDFMASAGMDMSRIPGFAVSTPERTARRIRRAIERDATWAFTDLPTRLAVAAARLLPARVRVRVFRNLFWELPT